MNIIQDNWRRLTFNVMAMLPTASVLQKYHQLQQYQEFKELDSIENVDANNIMRYIILYYDPGSQIRELYNEIGKQKFEAAKLAGFELDGDHFEPEVEEILYSENEVANKAIIRYLRILKNAKYSQLMIYTDSLYSELQRLRNAGGRTKETIENIDKLESRVAELTREFLSGDMSRGLVYSLYSTMEAEELNITPEEIAVLHDPFKQLLDE